MKESLRRREIVERLARSYPGSAKTLCELRFDSPFQLLAATILSAQCTDERVNAVTRVLFVEYPTPADMAGAEIAELERVIYPTGFFRNKAKSLIGMAQAIASRGGTVPTTIEELTKLPGVGRKTANVLLSVAFGLPGLPVDTHVARLSARLGLTKSKDPVQIEKDLLAWVAPGDTGALSLRLILHGRRVCAARRPACEQCVLADICPSAGRF